MTQQPDDPNSSRPPSPPVIADPSSQGAGARRLVQKINPLIKRTIDRLCGRPVSIDVLEPPDCQQQPLQPPCDVQRVAPSPSDQRPVKKVDPILARTKVDLDACKEIVKRMVSDKEVKVRQHSVEMANAELLRALQPVDSFRRATPCGIRWEMMSGSDQYRVCSLCRRYVYDFSEMSRDEASKLVMRREGNENPSLWRRADGRFLTADCPVGVARGRRMLVTIGCLVLLLSASIALAVLAPPPPPPAVTEAAEPVKQADTVVTVKDSRAGEDGDSMEVQVPAQVSQYDADANKPSGEPEQSMYQSPSGRYVTVPVEVFEAPGGPQLRNPMADSNSAQSVQQSDSSAVTANQAVSESASHAGAMPATPAAPTEVAPVAAPAATPEPVEPARNHVKTYSW